MKGISITNMEEFGHSGWRWTERYMEPYAEEETERECRTNQSGDGLFHWSDYRGGWIQDRGTCQFSLSKKRKNAYQQIRRRIEREVFAL